MVSVKLANFHALNAKIQLLNVPNVKENTFFSIKLVYNTVLKNIRPKTVLCNVFMRALYAQKDFE